MDYRLLGNSGLKVSAICLGTHDFRDAKQSKQDVHTAFERGINFIDTSCSYGEKGLVEELTGQAIKDLPRDEYILATKVRWGYGATGANNRGLSRKHLKHSLDISLQRLDVDFIDLYQLHGPVPDCPLEETIKTMEDFIRQGKVLYWGLSNFNAALTTEVFEICEKHNLTKPISHQPEYSLLQPGLVDSASPAHGLDLLSEKYGFGIIPYSPLAGGMLTGKYLNGIPEDSRMKGDIWGSWKKRILSDENLEFVRELKVIADDLSISMSQLSLAWLLQKPFISSVINGFTKVSQLDDNIKALDITLDGETLKRIDQLRLNLKRSLVAA